MITFAEDGESQSEQKDAKLSGSVACYVWDTGSLLGLLHPFAATPNSQLFLGPSLLQSKGECWALWGIFPSLWCPVGANSK